MKALEPFRDKLLVLSGLAQVQRPRAGRRRRRPRARGRHVAHRRASQEDRGAISTPAFPPTRSPPASSARPRSSARSRSASKARRWRAIAIPAIAARTPTPSPGARPPRRMPVEVSPRAVFERLFGDGDSTDPGGAPRRAARSSAASSITSASDVARLESGLGRATAASSTSTWSDPRHRAPHPEGRRAERHHEDAGDGAAHRHSRRVRRPCQADDATCRSSPSRPT